jgi:predicted membrane-bound dolichyl-phosphate-mannose-protein mannosyltransferase
MFSEFDGTETGCEALTLAERDDIFMQIEGEIEKNKQYMMEKNKYLQKVAKENQYLEMINNDYQKYYNYIIKQKRDQINAMNYLKEYLDILMIEGKLTDQDLEDARQQREHLLVETGKIKQTLNELIEE